MEQSAAAAASSRRTPISRLVLSSSNGHFPRVDSDPFGDQGSGQTTTEISSPGVVQQEGSTISRWARRKKFCCCGSVEHVVAWIVGLIGFTTSIVTIWAYIEFRRA